MTRSDSPRSGGSGPLRWAIHAALLVPVMPALPAAAQTTISSVYCGRSLCPDPIRLSAGQSVTISLRGQGLGDITGGAAVSGRMSSPDVQVTLGTVGLRGTSRPVTLAAASGAAGAEGLGLRFTLRTRLSITAPVGLSVVSLSAPPPSRSLSNDPVTSVEPTIDGASPSRVELYPGGSATLVLTGNNLSGYRSGSVRLGGTTVGDVSATVVRAEAARLDVRLDVDPSLATSSGVIATPLELVLVGTSPPNLTAPAQIVVLPALERLDGADWAAVAAAALQNASVAFNSCGPSDAGRRFSVSLPAVAYSAAGSVPRLEYGMNFDERMAFLELHSLDPTDMNEINWGSFTSTDHPTSASHTVTRVRMCLGNLVGLNTWEVEGLDSDGSGTVTAYIGWHFPEVRFIGRGMPADPSGNIEGQDVGILWGSDIAHTEIPDLTYDLLILTSLELRMESGGVSYTVRNETPGLVGSWVPGPEPNGRTLMPASVELSLDRFASDRIQTIVDEIRKAMEAPATRAAISTEILARLGS